VGLSAYAAAAISHEDPIKTGIQGFFYDIRTAILPFMFVFNTDLLLIGIDAWWHIGIIFITGAIAMFAFAALVQHHVLARNRWYESVLLLATVLILLRPDLTPISKFACYAIGIALFAGVHALQWRRRPVAGPRCS
jgi:TRAP-type uncharacterized transport system fused permease subunit